jgi:Domain of Unknown Function (DUF928)
MTQQKWCIRLALILTSVSLVLVDTVYVAAQSSTSTPRTQRNTSNSILRSLRRAPKLRYTLPPKGAPGQRADAGSRSECSPLDGPLVALVPPTNIGLTAAMRPTFWFYIPYKPNKRAFGKFRLLDEAENIVYITDVPNNGTAEITSIDLPQNLALQIGQKYRWVLSFACSSTSTQASTIVNGFIERVAMAPQLEQQLNVATSRERILIYGENGLWFDMLTALITELRNQPQSGQLAEDWEDLLKSPEVNLSELLSKKYITNYHHKIAAPI